MDGVIEESKREDGEEGDREEMADGKNKHVKENSANSAKLSSM